MVSRIHLQITIENGLWVVTDHSTHGTFDGAGLPVERVALGHTETSLHLGSPAGPTIGLVTAEATASSAGPSPVVPSLDVDTSWTVATTDPTLRVEIDGRDHAFVPPAPVLVGRDPGCDVVSDNKLVSRQHLGFTHDANGWHMEDLGSSRGSYVDGKRLRRRMRAQGAFVVMLGDADAGERLQVVTAGTHRKPRRPFPVLTAAGVLVVAVLSIIGLVLAIEDDDDEQIASMEAVLEELASQDGQGEIANTRDQLDAAARASALIIGHDANDDGTIAGSGSVVTSDGLVLTNAHVALPNERAGTEFQDEPTPVRYRVYVVKDPGQPVYEDEFYWATLEAVNPNHDAALLRITSNADGDPVKSLDGPAMSLGDSTVLSVGTPLHQLGFPSVADSFQISVASVTLQSFRPSPPCGEIETGTYFESCSPDGPLLDGLMNLSSGTLDRGSSGGPVVHHGHQVALNTSSRAGSHTMQNVALPIGTIREWLTEHGVPT